MLQGAVLHGMLLDLVAALQEACQEEGLDAGRGASSNPNSPAVAEHSSKAPAQTGATDSRQAGPLAALLPTPAAECAQLGGLTAAAVLDDYRRRLLPQATALAAALEVHWCKPQQWRAALFGQAGFAAMHSCSYLRCANLGPDCDRHSGAQQGSQKCGGCRVARYCGPACSHADWKAGRHKHVCRRFAKVQLAWAAGGGLNQAAVGAAPASA